MALTTDVTPRVNVTPVQVLQDPHKMRRLKTALAAGIFSGAVNEAGAAQIVDECLQICGGSTETLSEVLETKFLAGHTPFYWIIINRHPLSPSGVPNLLAGLLGICKGRELSQDSQWDILDAFYLEYDSDVYSAIQSYIPGVKQHQACTEAPFSATRKDRPRVTASNSGAVTIEFSIPQFFSRLLVDEEIYFEFLFSRRVLGVKMRLSPGGLELARGERAPAWALEISQTWVDGRFNEISPCRLDRVEIIDPHGRAPPLEVFRSFYASERRTVGGDPVMIEVPRGNLGTLRRNPYTSSPDSRLCGRLVVY